MGEEQGPRGRQGPPGQEAERAQTPDGALPSRVTWRSRQLLTATVRELNTIGKEVLVTTSAEQQVHRDRSLNGSSHLCY